MAPKSKTVHMMTPEEENQQQVKIHSPYSPNVIWLH